MIIFIGTHSHFHIPCLGRGDVLGIAPPFPQPPGTHCRTVHTGEPAMASLKPYPRWRHWGIALIRRTSCGRTVLDPQAPVRTLTLGNRQYANIRPLSSWAERLPICAVLKSSQTLLAIGSFPDGVIAMPVNHGGHMIINPAPPPSI